MKCQTFASDMNRQWIETLNDGIDTEIKFETIAQQIHIGYIFLTNKNKNSNGNAKIEHLN